MLAGLGEKGLCWWDVNGAAIMENGMKGFPKIKSRNITWSSNSTPEYLPKENEN